MSEQINLEAIERRIRDSANYKFGTRDADRLAHVDAPVLLAEAYRARILDAELADLRSDFEDILQVANEDGIEMAKSHALRTARITARRRRVAIETIRGVVGVVTEAHGGDGSHFEGCWKHHAACLAVVVAGLIEGAQTDG